MHNLNETSRILREALDWATDALGRLFRHTPPEEYVGRHRLAAGIQRIELRQVVARW